MDVDDFMDDEVNVTDHANGVLDKLPLSGGECSSVDKENWNVHGSTEAVQPNGRSESIAQLEESKAIPSSARKFEEQSIISDESKIQHASEEPIVKDSDGASLSKSKKCQGKSKKSYTGDRKLSIAKPSVENNNGELVKATAVPHSSLTLPSCSKQPFSLATHIGPFNGRRASERWTNIDLSRPMRPASQPSSSLHSKPLGKSGSATSTDKVSESDDMKEQKKNLKPLKKGTHNKGEEHSHSASLSSIAASSKPCRLGTAPSYSFSFRCDERAEKRKEFFSKLEEKIHAKEVEKTNLQTKSKEMQEAEIRLLRKSLTFRATPMPSFYHEPAPPKVELKKIPPTRAKSPKLGRHKSSPLADSEGNGSHSCQSARLSLDERISEKNPGKESPTHSKKPLRKSLPKLPSEKSTLADLEPLQSRPPKNLVDKSKAAPATDLSQTESKQDEPIATEGQVKLTEQEAMAEAITSLPSSEG